MTSFCMVAGFVWQERQLEPVAYTVSAPAPRNAIISIARLEVALYTVEPPCESLSGPTASAVL